MSGARGGDLNAAVFGAIDGGGNAGVLERRIRISKTIGPCKKDALCGLGVVAIDRPLHEQRIKPAPQLLASAELETTPDI